MPIEIQSDDPPPIDIRPNTNEAAVLAVLATHPNQAFTQVELAERAEVGRTSIYKTVERLIDKGLIQRYTDGEHVHVNHDRYEVIYRRLRSFRDTQTFKRLFDGDYFSEHPDWADEFDDFGRERLPEPSEESCNTADYQAGVNGPEISDLSQE